MFDKQTSERYLMLQHKIAVLLAAMYLQEQEAQAIKTPHHWRAFTMRFEMQTVRDTINNQSLQILGANARRASFSIQGDPTVPMILSTVMFDLPTAQAQISGTESLRSGVLEYIILPAGATINIETCGPVYGGPAVNTGGSYATVGIVETMYEIPMRSMNGSIKEELNWPDSLMYKAFSTPDSDINKTLM